MQKEPLFEVLDGIPTVFADGILNLANGRNVVKFYLGRLDPTGDDINKTVACAQVIMSMDGFVNAVAFLEKMTAKLIAEGFISPEALESARRKE